MEKVLKIFRAPYGSDKTPVEDREYKVAELGLSSPVGSIKEFKDHFKPKGFTHLFILEKDGTSRKEAI